MRSAVELFELPPSDDIWPGRAESWNLCAVVAGRGVWQYRRTRYAAQSGSILLKEPGEKFATPLVDQPLAFKILRFPPSLVAELLSPLTQPPHLQLGQRDDQRLFELTCGAFARLSMPGLPRLQVDSIVQLLICEVLASGFESPLASERHLDGSKLERVREYLEAHYAEELSLATLAGLVSLHEVYLVRAFRRAYGLPPHAYQLRLRVLAARRILADGLAAADASLAVGFFDQSHLTRHFKRVLGMTPGQYQRGFRSTQPVVASTAPQRRQVFYY